MFFLYNTEYLHPNVLRDYGELRYPLYKWHFKRKKLSKDVDDFVNLNIITKPFFKNKNGLLLFLRINLNMVFLF